MGKTDFARQTAVVEMKKWGLDGWEFKFNRRKRSAGICQKRRDEPTGSIEVSLYFLERAGEEEIRVTILHEIAHALAGIKEGHGPAWKQWCRKLGIKPERCCENGPTEGNYKGACPGCGKAFFMFRRPKNMNGHNCRECGPVRGAFVWEKSGADRVGIG